MVQSSGNVNSGSNIPRNSGGAKTPNAFSSAITGSRRNPAQAEKVRKWHEGDDVDVDGTSHHHTLGEGPSQAAPGPVVAEVRFIKSAINNINDTLITLQEQLTDLEARVTALESA